jgi:hypothetical protein
MTSAFFGKQAFVAQHGLDECATEALEQTIVAQIEQMQHETAAAETAKKTGAGPPPDAARKKARRE